MINILRNNVLRLFKKKFSVVIPIVLIVATLFFSNYYVDKLSIKMQVSDIAVVMEENSIPSNQFFNVMYYKENVDDSEVIMGKYDAVVNRDENGNFIIKTSKSDEYEKVLLAFLQGAFSDSNNGFFNLSERCVVFTNYMIIVIMMLGISFSLFYKEDKEVGIIKRIKMSSISAFQYLLSQFFFVFAIVFLVTSVVVAFGNIVFKIDLGIDLLSFLMILALGSFFSAGFGILCVSIMKNMNSMLTTSSSIVVLMVILSGMIISIPKEYKFLTTLSNIIPLKKFGLISQSIANGAGIFQDFNSILYILVFIVVFCVLSLLCSIKEEKG